MYRVVPVGLGELKLSRRPDVILVTYGLGSCIALTAYDPILKVGAMAHIILPRQISPFDDSQIAKFGDRAVPALLKTMLKNGAKRDRLLLKMAGGANVIPLIYDSKELNIGPRNIEAVRAALEEEGLHLSGFDVGGNTGRTMKLFIEDGRTIVQPFGGPEKEI